MTLKRLQKDVDCLKKLRFHVLFVLAMFILQSCKQNTTPSVNHAASPFDTTHFETQALSADDRVKLSTATGKTVKPIEINALADKIKGSTGKLHVYCFWGLNNEGSISTLKAIKKVSEKFDSTQLKVVYVNMPLRETVDAVNLFIRENQLIDETFILEKADVSFFSKKIRKDFIYINTLPVVLLVNKATETLLFYDRKMDEKELTTLIQPLLTR